MAKKAKKSSKKLYTLSEVSEKTGISMPTLLRYKKAYQRRIPAVGKGRTQRYPASALKVFKEIKKENLAKRGRPAKKKTASSTRKRTAPRKKAAPKKRKKPATTKAKQKDLLTLSEIGRQTGISYPTLIRYVKVYGKKIPSVGRGRKRRFRPEAVAVFSQLRAQSRRGRKKGTKQTRATTARVTAGANKVLNDRIKKLEKAQAEIGKQLEDVIKLLKRPLQVTIKSK
jgi:predicted site-specific integrase-resolvase